MSALRPLRVVLLVGLAALAALPLGSADAAKPRKFTVEIHQEFVNRILSGICDFDVLQRQDGSYSVLIRFDQAGTLIADVDHFHVDGSWSANGNTVPFVANSPGHTTYDADGTVVIVATGINARVTIPGQGTIAVQIGQGVLTYHADGGYTSEFRAGIDNAEEFFGSPDSPGSLCDLLA